VLPVDAFSAGAAMYFPTPDRTAAVVALAPGFENQLLRRLSGSSGLPASACNKTKHSTAHHGTARHSTGRDG
jgi:hypothetical protein